ncbi:hypothetical protein HNP55_004670 [Paucibacter oligotrophus]|uniref:CENP-V/GFA domain-containing protein n=1 Tax=Roseateles oligotrophus TaxID=1769250 RepID=A0A840LD71_9BURK|nr:GFA family protein [Roseateles oligotrophus]MBB4846116.1 hypothetical protein [Roseateles oligotrophus]
MKVTGACHCGRIRFEAEADPSKVLICHCLDCQILTGTAFRLVIPAALDSFMLDGEPRRYVRTGDSGARRIQAFCGDCGSQLFAMAEQGASQVNLRVGVLDQRQQLTPALQIWRRSALPWLGELGQVAACERQELLD